MSIRRRFHRLERLGFRLRSGDQMTDDELMAYIAEHHAQAAQELAKRGSLEDETLKRISGS